MKNKVAPNIEKNKSKLLEGQDILLGDLVSITKNRITGQISFQVKKKLMKKQGLSIEDLLNWEIIEDKKEDE